MGLVAPRRVGSPQTRAQTRVPCIGRRILDHCATREALSGTPWRKEQTEDLQRVLRAVDSEIPLVFVSGNHDVGNIPTPEIIAEFQRTWGDDYFSFWVGGILFLVLNSQFLYHASMCSALKQAQDQRLDQQLSIAGQQKCQHVVVFQHILLFLQSIDEDDYYFNLTKSMQKEVADKFVEAASVFTQTCGLQEGDHLALILPRVPEWWLVTVSCVQTGIIFMPGTTQMKAKDILYRLQVSKAKGIVTTDILAPETFFKYPITRCFAAPSVFRTILQQNFTSLRFPTLQHCVSGGEALQPEDQEQWRRQTGLLLYEAHGQSETIVDDKGNILPPNTEGNIGIRIKPSRPIDLFWCYENNPVKTAEVECGDVYNTGDRATIDAEGYIWFLGRADDVINASRYRIGPAEVENALAEHPAVVESAVVSSPDPIGREVVKAFIVLTPEFLSHDRNQLTKELQRHAKSVTAPCKYPRKVESVSELPKTITGKIKRSELRKKAFAQV